MKRSTRNTVRRGGLGNVACRLGVEALERRVLLDGEPLEFTAGAEFRVNTHTAGDQRFDIASPQGTAMDADGDAVVVWASQGQEGDDDGVFAQRYAADGSKAGDEFQVNSYTIDGQLNASVAMDADGDFVVTWSSDNQDGDDFGIYARRYNAAGEALGGEFRVNQTTAGPQRLSSIAADSQGNFIVTWRSQTPDNVSQILARRFDSAGAPLSDEFLVNEPTTEELRQPHVAANPQGEFAITWERGSTPARLSPIGQDTYARVYNADGTPRTAEFRVHENSTGQQIRSTVAMSAAGQVVVTWYNQALGDDAGAIVPRDVYMRRFSRDGTPLGPDVLVNASVSTTQQRLPAIAMDALGNFAVAWASEFQAGDAGLGVYLQSFSAAGEKLGGETRVNVTTAGNQSLPSIAMAADGDFLVAWTNIATGGSGNDVFARRFTRDDDVAPPIVANVYVDGDDHALAEAETLLQRPSRLVVTFSEAIDADPLTNARSKWRLFRNGVDESDRLELATHVFNGATNRYEAILEFQSPLPPGEYALRALPTIRDLAGHALDGNGDGVGGDAFERHFTITAPAPAGGEYRLNAGLAGDQTFAGGAPGTIARDAAGNMVVVWKGGEAPSQIWLRRFDSQGTPLTGDELVSDLAATSDESQPVVAMAPDGRFVVAWTGLDAEETGIYARRYDADGVALGAAFLVNEVTVRRQERPSAAMSDDGGFVIAWQGAGQLGSSGFEIVMQRFDSAGAKIDQEEVVNQDTSFAQTNPSVDVNALGEVVIAWMSPVATPSLRRIFVRRYSPADRTFTPELQVDELSAGGQSNPSVAIDSSGHVVVAWQAADANLDGVFAQRYDGRGRALGGRIAVNTITPGDQELPAVGIDEDGDIVVAWQSLVAGTPTLRDVAVRRFAWNGEPQDAEELVLAKSEQQTTPNLAVATNGDFTVAWTTGATGNGDLFAQRFASLVNARPTAVAGGPYELAEGGSVLLDAGQSVDPDAGPADALRFDWDLDGNGAFDDLVNVNAATTVNWALLNPLGIRDDGVYAIRLLVTDSLGATSVADATLAVRNAAPSAPTLDPVASVNEGALATLSGSFVDAGLDDGHQIQIEWQAGVVEVFELPPGARTFAVSHRYADDSGLVSYQARVSVLDDDGGASDVVIAPIAVRNVAPSILSVDRSAESLLEGDEWTIVGRFEDPGALDEHRATIIWGDGSSSLAVVNQPSGTFTASHVFADDRTEPGGGAPLPYSVQVLLQDADGGLTVQSTTALVLNAAPTIPVLQLDSTAVAAGDVVTLAGEVRDAGALDSLTLLIQWGDDTASDTVLLGPGEPEFSVQHVYAPTGRAVDSYGIQVIAIDSDNALAAREIAIDVYACGVAGDTDFNCAVDLDDLNAVRNHFGAIAPAGERIAGDAYPFDGVVDLDDLNAVRNNFGASSSATRDVDARGVDAKRRAAQDAVFAQWTLDESMARLPLERRAPGTRKLLPR